MGPTLTSYHDMNQSPGTSMRMLSLNRPPRYHAESPGVRAIMAPPVATGIESAKMPRGPLTALMMFCSGSVRSALAQSTGGICGARSKRREAATRSCCEVPGGKLGRTWFCSPYSQAMNSICTAPPRYQFPCSV